MNKVVNHISNNNIILDKATVNKSRLSIGNNRIHARFKSIGKSFSTNFIHNITQTDRSKLSYPFRTREFRDKNNVKCNLKLEAYGVNLDNQELKW